MESRDMDQRPTEPRRRRLKQGKIPFNHRQSGIACLVRNLSDAGACLEVASQAGVPPTFELQIEGETAHRRGLFAWQTDKKTRGEFRAGAGNSPAQGEPERRRQLPRPPPPGAPPAR